MTWLVDEDKFKFKIEMCISKEQLQKSQQTGEPIVLNKRVIAGICNGQFDPMGLISPLLAKSKILLRKVWGQDKKLGWDEQFSDLLSLEWVNFLLELYDVENIAFPRCVKPSNAVGDPVLIIFSDGSGDI